MKKSLDLFMNLIALSVLLICTACAQPVAVTALPAENVFTIGFTTSLTGEFINQSTDQTNGIKLWIKHVNEAGGLRMTNGDMITLTYKTYDDQSDPLQAKLMYEKLIQEDNVDVLFGPYSSKLTESTAPRANQYGKIYISAGDSSNTTFSHEYQTVYQIYSPASQYAAPAFDLLTVVEPGNKTLAILYENDPYTISAANSIAFDVESHGYTTIFKQYYQAGTTDFSVIVQQIKAAQPDVILAGGEHAEDGLVLSQELDRQDVQAKLIVLLLSPCADSFGDLGEAALGIICPTQWDLDMPYSPFTVPEFEGSWRGPTSPEFIMAYQQAYGKEPTYYAAGGYAAGLTLQNAIEKFNSINQDSMLVALNATNIITFFGHIQFDSEVLTHGLQIGHDMVYLQWQRDSKGEMVKHIVWPINMANAPLLYPIP